MVATQVHPDSIVARADALSPSFLCSCTDEGLDTAWVHVAGDLDISTTPQLVRMLRETQSRAGLVVLDLRELAFMDCSGLHAIVNASIRARRVGRRLILLRGRASVDRLFALTGTSDEVEIGDVDMVEPTVQSLRRSLVSLSLLRGGGEARHRVDSR